MFNFRDEYIARRNLTIDLAGSPIQLLPLPDLIVMKRASGRPQDLEDVAGSPPAGSSA